MPYGVTCRFVVLHSQPVGKDEMSRIADNIQVKKNEYLVYVIYQKLATLVISWCDFILSNIHYAMAKNLLTLIIRLPGQIILPSSAHYISLFIKTLSIQIWFWNTLLFWTTY